MRIIWTGGLIAVIFYSMTLCARHCAKWLTHLILCEMGTIGPMVHTRKNEVSEVVKWLVQVKELLDSRARTCAKPFSDTPVHAFSPWWLPSAHVPRRVWHLVSLDGAPLLSPGQGITMKSWNRGCEPSITLWGFNSADQFETQLSYWKPSAIATESGISPLLVLGRVALD